MFLELMFSFNLACGSELKSGGSVALRWEYGTALIGASAQLRSSRTKLTPEQGRDSRRSSPCHTTLRHCQETDCRSLFQTMHRPTNIQVQRLIPCGWFFREFTQGILDSSLFQVPKAEVGSVHEGIEHYPTQAACWYHPEQSRRHHHMPGSRQHNRQRGAG